MPILLAEARPTKKAEAEENKEVEPLTAAYERVAERIKGSKKLQKRITGLQLIEHTPLLNWIVGCAHDANMSVHQWQREIPLNMRALDIAKRQLDNMLEILRRFKDEEERERKEMKRKLDDKAKEYANRAR